MSHDITYFMIFMNYSSYTTFRKLNVTVKPVKKSTFGFGSSILLPLEVSSWKVCVVPFLLMKKFLLMKGSIAEVHSECG